MTYLNVQQGVNHVPQFGGQIYYVSLSGNDSNDGKSPKTPLLTIGAAIGKLSAGDAINVMAGVYTETGIDLNVNYCEIWFEIGAQLTPVSGTVLTVSGNSCRIRGQVSINPAAGATGIIVSGTGVHLTDIANDGGAIAFQITGAGIVAERCCSKEATSISFDIQAGSGRYICCNVCGQASTGIGYKISNSSDKGIMRDCTSLDQGGGGFYFSAGCSEWTIINCSSGKGDGKWEDVDEANKWVNFSFDNRIEKEMVLSGTDGGAGAAYIYTNLYKVTGSVRISRITGIVMAQLSSSVEDSFLEIFSTNGSEEITLKTAGRDLDSAQIGSIIEKNAKATTRLDYIKSTGPNVDAATSENRYAFVAVQDKTGGIGVDTYIRYGYMTTNDPASGEIHWFCEYEPISEDGFLEAA